MSKRPTVTDVARLAGVSAITVSRVLHDHPSVSEGVREAVVRAVSELGYRPNLVAQELRNTRSRTIGVVYPDLSHQAVWGGIRAMESQAELLDYAVYLGDSALDAQREVALLRRFHERRVAGMIVYLLDQVPDIVDRIAGDGVPIVSLGARSLELSGPALSLPVDYRKGLVSALARLRALGHQHVGVLVSQRYYLELDRRRIVEGYAEANNMRLTQFSLQLDATALTRAFRGADAPTALLMLDSDLLPLALWTLADVKRSVPEDVSVIVVGSSDWLTSFRPSLAYVRVVPFPRGAIAAKQLVAMIEGRGAEAASAFETEFVAGDSIGPAPGRKPSIGAHVRSA